jgi:hypothetical protein
MQTDRLQGSNAARRGCGPEGHRCHRALQRPSMLFFICRMCYFNQKRGFRFSFCILFSHQNALPLRRHLCRLGHRLKFHLSTGFKGEKKRLRAAMHYFNALVILWCKVIVFSMVRSNTQGEVGFLSEQRRNNVAITRARRLLCVFTL